MLSTMHRSAALAVAALWALPASAGDLPPASVYVAPGGVYIGSAQVYAGPGAGNGGQPYAAPGAVYGPPAYAPGYGPPAYGSPAYAPPAYAPGYGVPAPAYQPTYAPIPAYRAPPIVAYGASPRVVARPYAYSYPTEYAPRPPAIVPYTSGNNCVFSHGRVFCD
ncbi:MAG: hypothetical protein K2Y71_16225 [Xanthobacteraceae bacterium]|nr:hypothetical protein [Xanthobacteraceae bacterium]